MAIWLLPTPGGASTTKTRGAAGSSRASAIASASDARSRACSGRGEEPGYRCELERELAPVTYWFRRDGRQIKKTVRWFLMRPLEKVGDHDHEVDEVLWTDKDDALARLRYDSDRRLVGAV